MNEIVFPAAILQPPFFDVQADDAVNYGGIGAVIGHEMSHGFDDRGQPIRRRRQSARLVHHGGSRQKFAAKDARRSWRSTTPMSRCPGYHVNGELTLGENIGDNSGLAIAYKAYRLSLAGKSPPVIDGFTGDQRLYLGWVQVWRGKVREAEAIQRIKTDPHSPAGGARHGAAASIRKDFTRRSASSKATRCTCRRRSASTFGSKGFRDSVNLSTARLAAAA